MLYSIQIYCDFSGYADIAIGSAKLFSLRLSKNLDYPYFSTSVQMFRRRWHITLASWMRDYVYLPLGGSRVGALRRALNVLATFLLVGLWHGANWTLVVWGLLHGCYLVVESGLRAARRRRRADAAARPWLVVVGAVVVFALVTFAWVFFRAPSLSGAVDYFMHAVTVPQGRQLAGQQCRMEQRRRLHPRHQPRTPAGRAFRRLLRRGLFSPTPTSTSMPTCKEC